MDLHSVPALRPTDDTDDQVIGPRARPQQEPAMQRAHGDLDQ